MEKMVNKRLMRHLEHNNSLSDLQCGFRNNRSTIDHLVRLESFIRLALGAFRTSPVESLYAEVDEPPLALRRTKLALQYASKIEAHPKNPAHTHIQAKGKEIENTHRKTSTIYSSIRV